MKAISLFSGIGAATLGVHAHYPQAETVLFCEADKYAQQVLALRFPGVPVVDDVRELTLQRGAADLIEAGFPCQDLSAAGRKAGLDGARSGLYGEVLRLVGEAQPRLVLLENVPALLKYRGRLEREFAELGYGLTWCKIAAAHIGAPHRRLRVMVLAERGGSHRGVVDAGPLPSATGWQTPRAHSPQSAAAAEFFRNSPSLACEVLPASRWQTPRASDTKDGRGKRGGRDEAKKAKAGATLPESVKPIEMATKPPPERWATPAARDWKDGAHNPHVSIDLLLRQVTAPEGTQVNRERKRNGATPQRWATPCAVDSVDRGNFRMPSIQRRMEIGKQVTLEMSVIGKLSPDWVEALQGLPVGWTDLQCDAPRVVGWPAPMVRGMWGDSPQHDGEPPRTVAGRMAHRPARLRALGNANPPQQYAEALRLLERGPAQRSIFDMLGAPCEQ